MRLLLVLFFCSCAATGPTPQETLDRSVFSYNQHLRWKRFDKASHFVDKNERAKFSKSFEGSDEILSIDDLEVKEVSFDSENKAKVTVDARYFKLPSVTLKKDKWVQVWVRRDDDWWLSENARGPFFPDPASMPASVPSP